MPNAIGYIRVSTSEQNVSGLGLENQRQKIEEFCKLKGYHLVEIIEEGNGLSGGVPIEERPHGARLCAMLRDRTMKIKAVVTLKLDRAFRDAEDALHHAKEWIKLGVSINFLDMAGMDATTSIGMLQLTMMAGFSEFERKLIADRTRAALQVKRSRSEKLGGLVPYGFAWTMNKDGKKTLFPYAKEQEVIGLIKKMRDMEMSPEKIAARLNDAGVQTKMGKRWNFKQIYRILARRENG